MKPQVEILATVVSARFWDSETETESEYRMTLRDCRKKYAEDILKTFVTQASGVKSTTRNQYWRKIKQLLEFSNRRPTRRRDLQDPELLFDYKFFLAANAVSPDDAMTSFNRARSLYQLLQRDFPDNGWSRVRIPSGKQFSPAHVRARPIEITPETLSTIAQCCKKEIDGVRLCMEVRYKLESGIALSESLVSKSDQAHLSKIYEAEKRGAFSKSQLKGPKTLSLGRSQEFNKLSVRRIAKYRMLTNATALPYLLLLLVQTGANPESLQYVNLDCVRAHSTDPQKKTIYWPKARSSTEQAHSFLSAGRYSISTLVDDIVKFTSFGRGRADALDRDTLFIAPYGARTKHINTQTWHSRLKEFRVRHGLPFFTFSDIRMAVAALKYHKSGDVEAVSILLQHRSARTTQRYLAAKDVVSRRYERVLEYQGEICTLATRPRHDDSTLFGLSCKDRHTGLAPGSIVGDSCDMWLECATCPNAIIVIDDPKFVARILKAKHALVAASNDAVHSADRAIRFESIYRPILRVIDKSILPRVPKKILHQAENVATRLPTLPVLE